MGRASNAKKRRRDRRIELGVDQIDLPAALKRPLVRALDRAPLMREIRSALSPFSRRSVIEECAATAERLPPILLGRLVREVASLPESGDRTITAPQLIRIAGQLHQIADPTAYTGIGRGRVHDVAITRVITDSLPFHSSRTMALHRTLNVMLDPVGPSLLDATHWTRRLGVPLSSLLIGALYFQTVAERGPFDVTEFRNQPSIPDVDAIVERSLAHLSCTLNDLTHCVRNPDGDLYDLGPLAQQPLIWIDENRVVAPSPAHIPIAVSPTALYLRLIREDGSKSRDRSQLVGDRFESHLFEYAASGLSSRGWTVRRLDDEPATGSEHSDVAIWPSDRSFLIIVETKASLSLVNAQLGDAGNRERMRKLYQKSFDQIGSTVRSVGSNGFLHDAPTTGPVFGLTVTLDSHLTSVTHDRTYFGLVLDYKPPGDRGASCDVATCRVVNSENIEILLDTLAMLTPAEALTFLEEVAKGPTPLVAVAAALDTLGYQQRLREAPPNPAIQHTLDHLCDDIVDLTFRQAILSIISSA